MTHQDGQDHWPLLIATGGHSTSSLPLVAIRAYLSLTAIIVVLFVT